MRSIVFALALAISVSSTTLAQQTVECFCGEGQKCKWTGAKKK